MSKELGEKMLREALGMDEPRTTAYDRDRQSLQDRLFKVECASDVLLKRLNKALQRIEQLEADVARLKAWSRPPDKMCMQCGLGFVNAEHERGHVCGMVVLKASPATAYPPLPDEGT